MNTILIYVIALCLAVVSIYVLIKWMRRSTIVPIMDEIPVVSPPEGDASECLLKELGAVSKGISLMDSEVIDAVDHIIESVQLVSDKLTDTETLKQVQQISRNSRKLRNMLNRFIDSQQFEMDEIVLNPKPGNLIQLVKDTADLFTDLAVKRNLSFTFYAETDQVVLTFDHQKIENVLFTLLTDAFKEASDGGSVGLIVTVFESTPNDFFAEIRIIYSLINFSGQTDSGYDTNYYDPSSIIRMHGGELTVFAEKNDKTYCIQLPIYDMSPAVWASAQKTEEPRSSPFNLSAKPKQENKRSLILLVEDDDDFRTYLKDNLKDNYDVIEAVNGKIAWQKALALHPDLLISDVRMPGMNGLDLCAKVKQDKRTSYISVILLTGIIDEEIQLKGLEIGVNDYITKPLNFVLFLAKIKNLLNFQELLRTTYKKQVDFQLPELKVASNDEKFLSNVLKYVEDNMTKSTLSIEDISNHAGMSRVSLYKKILALTGKSPVELINSIKLKKAVHLLETSQMKITEIAYTVGFNSPKYFGRLFKSEFKILPSEYVNQLKDKRRDATILKP